MNEFARMNFLVTALVLLLGLQTIGVQAADDNTPSVKTVTAPFGVVYKPPLRGAPQARVGGGTRGSGSDAVLHVLAPDHVGLTAQAQPTLYWYARTASAARLEIALIDAEGIDPLLEVEADTARAAGIQHLNLGDHGISLKPGVSYQWSVALVADAGSRAMDLVTSAVIEMIELDEHQTSRIKGSSGLQRVQALAGEGLWYDALDEISLLIAASPDDDSLRAARNQLLVQVGLEEIAAD